MKKLRSAFYAPKTGSLLATTRQLVLLLIQHDADEKRLFSWYGVDGLLVTFFLAQQAPGRADLVPGNGWVET